MAVMSFGQFDQLLEMGKTIPSIDDMPVAEIERVRSGLIESIRKNMVLGQYVRHLDRGLLGESPKNRFAWHAEGERQYAALMLASIGLPGGPELIDAFGNPLDEGVALGLAMAALMAQVYLWSDDIEALAEGTPLPRHTIARDALQFPVQFWSRETAHVAGGIGETNWVLLMHSLGGIRLICDVQAHGRASVMVGDIPYGRTFPDDFPDGLQQGAASVLGRLSFLASPYIGQEQERLPRAWRREARRNGVTDSMADPLIRVVKLRREVQDRVEREREERSAAAKERRSHWWVSGHHRAQWYPSREAHEVIWIAPYLKGDLAKPLASKVYAVVR